MKKHMTEAKLQTFKLKGRIYTFTVIQVQNPNPGLFAKELDSVISKAPKLFDHSPIVLDLSLITQENIELEALIDVLQAHQLYLVGLQGADVSLSTLALKKGIPLLHASSKADKAMLEYSPEETDTKEISRTKLVTTPIRSGQQAVSKGGDLVIAASVSPGAELLADGHIHVYGALRGRALAGMSGNIYARIFCQSLEAELVSIAGYYRLSDTMTDNSGPCQIYLQDEHICIDPIC